MLNRDVCEYTNSSFFLIDKNYQIISFEIDSLDNLGVFLERVPEIGVGIGEVIAQKYRKNFLSLLGRSFEGNCFSILQKFAVIAGNDLVVDIVFTPVANQEGQIYAVSCSIINNTESTDPLRMLREYSHVTSHELRAPITNILSLSTINNYHHLESYDILKINQLLGDINLQAVKLDRIIQTLNAMLNKEEEGAVFNTLDSVSDNQHIVLIDDDIVANKLHQMLIKRHTDDKNVVLFNDPELALNYVQEHQPDLILLDLHMPEIDGWKFLELLEERNIYIDVVIVSSSIDPIDRSRARSFSCVKDFYTKPLTIEAVKQLLTH
jgi:CheY-like chemotaxis protein